MTCHPASVACKPKVDSLAIRYHLSLFQLTRAYMPPIFDLFLPYSCIIICYAKSLKGSFRSQGPPLARSKSGCILIG
jgi:hypothetical protein